MRVLVQPRPQAPINKGGDWWQLMPLLEPLRELGVHTDISTDAHASLADYDACLIWNSVEPLAVMPYYFNARRQHARVGLMPIYWRLARLWELDASLRGMDVNEPMREMERLRRETYNAHERILLHGAEVLHPNSEMEAGHLQNDFGVAPEKIFVSHYGTLDEFAHGVAERFRAIVDEKDFVLCVGQIAPRKNQLTLIRALRDSNKPLVFLGDAENEAYMQLCRDEAQKNRARVYFIPRQTREVVADAFAAARVHAIVSIYDVGPQVTLEAAVAGVPQVVTTECSMPSYLDAPTVFVDPDDVEGIARGVEQVWNEPRTHAMAERLLRDVTWKRAAQELKTGLEWMLAQPPLDYDPFAELFRAQELLQEQIDTLWRLLGEQSQNARQVEQWAHELQAQLRAQKTFGARVKALVGK